MTKHHHPACEPLLAGGDGGADRGRDDTNDEGTLNDDDE
jgi:hypothetical protein